jgi:hypothetical protein
MDKEIANNKSISEAVMAAAEKGDIKMRPKWYFALRAALTVTGVAIFSLFLVYLASFIFFMLRRTGIWFAPSFGFKGLFVFLISLPWFLILLAAIFAVILEILVRRYSFAYRWPLLYSAVGIVLIVMAGGYAVAKTPFHGRLIEYERNRGPFCCGGIYRDMDRDHFNNIHVGQVYEIMPQGFRLQNRDEEILVVLVAPETKMPFGRNFSVGDAVAVIGKRIGAVINAWGIRRIDEKMDPMMNPPSLPPIFEDRNTR